MTLLIMPITASASTSLERMSKFFSEDSTYFAEFYQVILDEGLHLVEESNGLMWLARPDRFRWEYFEPLAQTIVSNGESVWVYDVELEQVTVRDYTDVVDHSAAEILSGISNLEKNYDIEDLGLQGLLAWVTLRPRDTENAQFESMRLGFDERSLKGIVIIDTLGNTTRLQLVDVILNDELDEKTFELNVPDGVDVIDSRENN